MSERNSKISGSNISALAKCPGKFNLEKGLPEQPAGPAAEMGTRIHAYLAGEEIQLSHEELEIADSCKKFYLDAIEAINAGEITKTIIEQRYWYDEDWSGAIDRIDFIGDQVAIVTDYKTGRIAQGKASENLQLRSYSVLVKKHFPGLKTIYVAVVQPMTSIPVTITQYDEADLAYSDAEIKGIIQAAYAPDAPRNPSPYACKYCRAKAICPEAQGEVKAMVKVDTAIVPQLTNDQLSDYLQKVEILEPLFEAFRTEAKERMKSGQVIDGYELKPGRITRSIEDNDAVVAALAGTLSTAAILCSAKISVPMLEKQFAAATGLKQKEAKTELERVLNDRIVSKVSEPVMTRTK
jgi:CRISPR/Cas system-associated exonuclease Cas4 (RecB family)